jgi:hypothetical protein
MSKRKRRVSRRPRFPTRALQRKSASIRPGFFLDAHGVRPHVNVTKVLDAASTAAFASNSDWLYIASGTHMDPIAYYGNANSDWYQTFSRILAAAERAVDQNPPKLGAFWRTAPIHHFRNLIWNETTVLGWCDLEQRPDEPFSVFDYHTAYPGILQNGLTVQKLSGKKHWSIVDAATVSEAREGAHRGGGDCSHWCLPGVPDSWNSILLRSIWDGCVG